MACNRRHRAVSQMFGMFGEAFLGFAALDCAGLARAAAFLFVILLGFRDLLCATVFFRALGISAFLREGQEVGQISNNVQR